jgi:alpha-tubulin suppressor-like RCC1 family protein
VRSNIGRKAAFVFGSAVSLLLAACGSGSSNSNEVIAVAAGYEHTCVVTGAGGVRCWGANESGQLGNGTHTDSSKPVDVTGLKSGVVAIAAGGKHTCALTTAGHVKCWGSTTGNNPTNSNVPVDVPGLGSGATAIAAGGLHACAITSGGGVKCWGTNGEGELGNGSTTDSDSPVEVSALTKGVSALAVGSTDDYLPTHTCALISAGGVKCWGPNGEGQLGNGTTTDSSRPVEVSGLNSGITAIAVGGSHTCAITKQRGLKCWGDNSNGQLGNGSLTNSPTPVDAAGS